MMRRSRKPIRTDGDVMRIARRIRQLTWAIEDLIDDIAESEHPNAAKIIEDLDDNYFRIMADATHVIGSNLEKPEQWDVTRAVDGRWCEYYHKGASKAAKNAAKIPHITKQENE